MDFLGEANKMKKQLIEHRRFLHRHPEVGFELSKTTDYVARELTRLRIDFSPCGISGIKGVIGPKGGRSLLLRADMDALPIKEETSVPYRAENGAMHACGHDFHTAILLGVASILKKHEEELAGEVVLMFQPAEEILEGAKDMLKSGILKDPHPCGAVMLHVITGRPVPTGAIVLPPSGQATTHVAYFEITVKGIGCHGASPHTGIDPLTAAAHLLTALQEISARELGIRETGIITVGSFVGGNSPNAIPSEAKLSGSFRSFEENTMKKIKNRLYEMTENICNAFRCKGTVSLTRSCPALINDDELLKKVTGILKNESWIQTIQPHDAGDGVGSEDFAYISREIPSLMIVLGAGEPTNGYVYPQHHPKADFDENALPAGVAILAKLGMELSK